MHFRTHATLRDRAADWSYRALLRALPGEERRVFGADMAQLFRDHRRALAGRPFRVFQLWIAAITDVAAAAVAARHPRRRRIESRPLMTSLWQDVKYGIRLLGRQRGFTAVALLVLALGIGANTAVFTIVNGMLLKPLAGHPAGTLAQIFSKDTGKPDTYRAFSYPNYLDVRAHTEAFSSVAAHSFAIAGLDEGNGSTRQVFVDMVTANFFDTFGITLAAGRGFTAKEERPGAELPVAVLSYPQWQRLGGGTDVLGRTIRVNARIFTVVGIAPRGFGGSMAFVTPDLWLPTGMYDAIANDFMRNGIPGTLASRDHHTLVLVAQLPPDQTLSSIGGALDVISGQMRAAFPVENKDQALLVAPLSRMSVSTSPVHEAPMRLFAGSLLVLSGLVLIIACFNLANMLLARGAARRREFAVRSAIGGGRWRLARQLLVEGALLASIAGALGLALAFWATHTLVSALAAFSPVVITFEATPDARVLAATIGFCAMATILFGLGPALGVARAQALPALKDRPGDVGGGRRVRLQHVLVMGQLALSLVLLTVSGLFVRGAVQAARVDPGFTFDRGVLIHADAALGTLDRSHIQDGYLRAIDALRSRPDVAAVGAASLMPFGDIQEGTVVQKAGAELPPQDPGAVEATYTVVTSGYFDALGLRLISGHDFRESDERTGGGEPTAIIDAPLARKLFDTGDPVGQVVMHRVRSGQPLVALRVIGVVPGLRQEVFDLEPVPHVYVPLGQNPRTELFIHVRTSVPTPEAEAALLPSLRKTIDAAEPAIPLLSVETLRGYQAHSLILSMLNLGMAMFVAFGAVALVLAMVGVYGVKAYVVSTRTREIGIRVALGATPRGVVWAVVREGFVLSMCGLALGALLSVGAVAGMRAFTFGNSGTDVATIGAAMLILAASAMAASWAPARRAARVQPTEALRSE